MEMWMVKAIEPYVISASMAGVAKNLDLEQPALEGVVIGAESCAQESIFVEARPLFHRCHDCCSWDCEHGRGVGW